MAEIQFYPDLLDYCNAKIAETRGSASFVGAFCLACVRADGENFETLRPALETIRKKHPARDVYLEHERKERTGKL
jgi:hypothetical protein